MDQQNFNSIKVSMASPEQILSWSYGEVIKPETINYRTQRPEKDGLFSERIFGPTKDWECYCGKYRRIRYKGVICDRCGVEVTRSIVRRERMGHIKLAAPVSNIWFLKSPPSRLSIALGLPYPIVEKVIYFALYIITDVDEENKKKALEDLDEEFSKKKKLVKQRSKEFDELKAAFQEVKNKILNLHVGQVITEIEHINLSKKFGSIFKAGTGAEAVRKILEQQDLKKTVEEMERALKENKDPQKQQHLLSRFKIFRNLERNNLRPEWMILTVLPVLPPDLRPMVALDGGRYATSDLNDLYRRVINRNNRLKKLLELKAPEIIVNNERRMLQEAVDALIDNTMKLGTQVVLSKMQKKQPKSLTSLLKGKQGRFRQNLLGKRVDYSGRSVIVIGPELKLSQCGLPKKMALELFRPFVIAKIIERGLAHNIKIANRLIEEAPPEVWEIVEEVIKNRKVLLNRAPTLHRLGVQAFEPVLIEDLSIRIPPMVTSAFNADFDGDQMAVHVPLGDEAQKEANGLMMSTVGLLKPATGDPIAVPTQDIVLGIYFLTKEADEKEKKLYSTPTEALMAYENDIIDLNTPITIKDGAKGGQNNLRTTVGRTIFNSILPDDFEYVNKGLNKRELVKLCSEFIERYGVEQTSIYLDEIKRLGFKYASLSGISWGMDDLIIPKEKKEVLEKAEKEVSVIQKQYEQGLLTLAERRARVIDVWDNSRSELAKSIPTTLNKFNSVFQIIDSGARGSWTQPIQMMAMKGLVQNPKGEIIELPVRSSYKEGLSVLEYFISTHGARKGTIDTALKTASAGYLTRRLVDVSQEIVVKEDDCGAKDGVEIFREDGLEFGSAFANRIFSRVALEDIKIDGKVVVAAGEIIDREKAELIDKSKLDFIKVRSPITCKTLYGMCKKCYGMDLGYNKEVDLGGAVGVIAAQSIGEPGTQLTMRTFHIGGIAGSDITHGLPRVEEIFENRIPRGMAILCDVDGVVASIEEQGLFRAIKVKSQKGVKEYSMSKFVDIYFKTGDKIKKGDQLSEGNLDLKQALKLLGMRYVIRYIIKEVQQIYLAQGSFINNKHIEIIIKQMFSGVKIKDSGDTEFVLGDIVDKSYFFEINRKVKASGGMPAKAQQVLSGITKAALLTEGFLSAASFQETTRVLIKAALSGKVDYLRGLKENVIIGKLIPSGTGYKTSTQKEDVDYKESEEDGEGKAE